MSPQPTLRRFQCVIATPLAILISLLLVRCVRIVNLANSNLCNIGTNLAAALRAQGHESRSIVLSPVPVYQTDEDLQWSNDPAMAYRLVEESEVLHLNSFLPGGTLMLTRPPIDLHRLMRGKRVILQYHGGDARRVMPSVFAERVRRAGISVFVTVPDLLDPLSHASWLPIPVPTDDPDLRPVRPPTHPFRVCHAPTMREIKKTDAFLRAMADLQKKYDVEPVLIEGKPYREALRIKRTCHVNFDNIGYGSYALASIESMLMEQPSMVWLNERCRSEVERISTEVGIEAPFVHVGDPHQPGWPQLNRIVEGRATPTYTDEDVASIRRAVERLLLDDGLRHELGRRSRAWASAVHDTRPVAERATKGYEAASPFPGFRDMERARDTVDWAFLMVRNLVRGLA